mmetsp:Transcript_106926/g.345043  ORF Transcript_106926/g.345043 Transcript_106926/m.345043 type:complete len:98 (+) Transcript_106926:260-553(+)
MPRARTLQPSAEQFLATSGRPRQTRGAVVVAGVVVLVVVEAVVLVVGASVELVGRPLVLEVVGGHGRSQPGMPQKRHSQLAPSAKQPRTPGLHHGSQ